MKIWLPYIEVGSGTDVFTQRLAHELKILGHSVELSPLPHKWQYFPWRLKLITPPVRTDIILTNSWNGFAFKRHGIKLVTVEHLCVHDPAFFPYRNLYQGVFHRYLVKFFERASFKASDAVVAVSHYTSNVVNKVFVSTNAIAIQNGVDIDFFTPRYEEKSKQTDKVIKLLFVGNLSRRKGADMLPQIMRKLGNNYHLRFTAGLQIKKNDFSETNMTPLGCMNQEQVRQEYQQADLLVFPTRLEGLPYVALEAMACGLPVVASNSSSLPEAIIDGETGCLCRQDDVDDFVQAIKKITQDKNKLEEMGEKARAVVNTKFNQKKMVFEYIHLFEHLLDKKS